MVKHPHIDVAIARFEDIVARGLRALIEENDNLRLVAAGIEQRKLAATLAAYRPHVAILNFGSLSSTSELRQLHRAHPDTRLLVLANRPTPSECHQLLAFGATGCLAKSAQARDLLHAIHLASRGLQVLPALVDAESDPLGPEILTVREAAVLELLRTGRSNAEIASTLQIGVETVRTHARRVYRKLGVKTRRELRTRR